MALLNRKPAVIILLLLISSRLFGQQGAGDTVRITLQQADSLFIHHNLALLAEQCNVDAAKALIIQARLFSNPEIAVNQNVYNTESSTNGGRKWFDYTDKGETSVQVQQLFLLARKRNKQIDLAKFSANREEENYFDLLRTLKYALRNGFYNLYFLEQNNKMYGQEISSLNRLIQVFQGQYEKGFVAKKELLRLKSALFSLENEQLGVKTQLNNTQADINLLLHTTNQYYLPEPDLERLDALSLDHLKLQTLYDTAFLHRYDLKMAQSDLKVGQMNYEYQKALAVPDVTVSAGWDRNGSYVHNYNFIGLQIGLPILNRNQGNIKAAKFSVDQFQYKLHSAEDQVKADVTTALATALENDRLYHQFDKTFILDLNGLNTEILKNYEKKNIGLLEFLDYYDAYKTNVVQLNTLYFNRIDAIEHLNFSVGKEVIPTK